MAMMNKEEHQVIRANGAFTKSLYHIFAKEKGDFMFSPISLHCILAQVYQGAKGETADALSHSLALENPELARMGYSKIMKTITKVRNVRLFTAQKIYAREQNCTLLESFDSVISENFQSKVEQVNFEENESTMKIINTWVRENTRDMVGSLVDKEDLNEGTRLVLVSGLFFESNWNYPFKIDLTRVEPFYNNGVEKVDVKMMRIRHFFRYRSLDDMDAQIVELAYENRDLSFVIILPNMPNGLGKLEEKLANLELEKIFMKMYDAEIDLYLPRFRIESKTIDMEEVLKKMGMGVIFDQSKADFSGIAESTGDDKLYVNKVLQKVHFVVNEDGTGDITKTGIVPAMRLCISPPKVLKNFKVNHPFIFYVISKSLGARNILFGGRVCTLEEYVTPNISPISDD